MKQILVTGSSGDIGSTLCEELLKDKDTEILGLDIESSRINNPRYKHIQVDLHNLEDLEKINWEEYHISGLIHVAGIYNSVALEEYDIESIYSVVNVNVLCFIVIIQQLLLKSTGSHLDDIIIVSSTAGKLGSRDPIYSLSKAAIDGAMKSFNKSLTGCRINIVSPGLIDTKMSREHQSLERRQQHINNTLAKRTGLIEDVTNVILFLLSKESNYIWGQNIYVNGGMI